jgi:hypothetical protein
VEFYHYRAAYEFHRSHGWVKGPPGHVYSDWKQGVKHSDQAIDPIKRATRQVWYDAEANWYACNCPYYKVWPEAISMLADVDVDIPCEFLRLPFSSFEVRFPMKDNPLQLANQGVAQAFLLYEPDAEGGPRRMVMSLDTGEVAPKGTPRMLVLQRDWTAGRSLDSAIELSKHEQTKGELGDIPPEVVGRCFRIAISICLLATGGDKLIDPEVMSKDLARFIEARRTGNVEQADRLIAKAQRRNHFGWNVGAGEKYRTLIHRAQHLGGEESGHHPTLTHQHQRRAHFRLLPSGKVTFVRQTTVRPDLPPPETPPGYGIKGVD